MQSEIENLLQSIETFSSLEASDAPLQLGLLLEGNRLGGSMKDSSLLPQNLNSVRLSPQEEAEIIRRIVDLIDKNKDSRRRHLYWILSKADPEVLLLPLLKSIQSQESSFDVSTGIQALFALHNCFENDDLLREHSDQLNEYCPVGFLLRMNTPEIFCQTNIVPAMLEKARSFVGDNENRN